MSPDSDDGPESIVDRYFEAVAHNDLDAIESIITEDFVQHPPVVDSRQDRRSFLEEWRLRIAENPDSALEYERVHRLTEEVDSGPRAGSWVHEWGKYVRSDGELSFKLSASFRVHGGRLDEVHAYFDRLDVMTQAGFTLTPPSA